MLNYGALKLLRRLLGAGSGVTEPHTGMIAVLDGNTAVAITEAVHSEAAALGASFPADGAELVWRAEQQLHRSNLAGRPLASHMAEGPRGALAATLGQALAGVRATGFLSAPDLAAAHDLLRTAAGRRVPLVIHLTLRALPGQGPALGDSHDALRLAMDSGCFTLVAANVQEAVDFALIARRATEQALIPGLVAMEGVRTALSIQEVELPPTKLVETYLGEPGDEISSPTPAQQLLFDGDRRRIPRWHNLDRPVLLGGLQPAETWGLGRAAGEVFFDAHLQELIDKAFREFAQYSGRDHRLMSSHQLEDPDLVLVAQGSAVETAEAVADHLRKEQKTKVGVLGVRCLSPFPGAEAARLLTNGARVCVLERMDVSLNSDPPLLREMRLALDRALENGHFDNKIHPGYPSLHERYRPRFISVIYGLGGLPLRAADLVALCRNAYSLKHSRIYLGLAFARTSSPYPKRQVLLDRLRRSYPDIENKGLRGDLPQADLRPPESIFLALYRLTGGNEEGLTADAAALLQRMLGGGLRSQLGYSAEAWGSLCVDRIGVGRETLRDLGDDSPVDLAIMATDPALPGFDLEEVLHKNSAVLIKSRLSEEALWAKLSSQLRDSLQEGGAQLYRVLPAEGADSDHNDYLLGALCAVLVKTGRLDVTQRQLLRSREALLEESGHTGQSLVSFEMGLEAARRVDIATMGNHPGSRQSFAEDEAPTLVRSLGNNDDAYDSLPRFWDQVGVLYRNGDTGELAPDPYLALGAVPPLSAGFRELSPARSNLPQIDPSLCTGCGACWIECPDSALGAIALTPARLLETGIRQAGADVLRPVATKLARGITELSRDSQNNYSTLGKLLGAAFERLRGRLPFPDTRKASMAQAVEAVAAVLGGLRPAITEPFFEEPETGEQGRGEYLFLSIDADTCKACGICLHVCETGAIENRPQNAQSLSLTRKVRRAWDLLPDTEPETIHRLRDHPDVGLLAASLLNRSSSQSLAGGDGAEPGSGAKLALRQALAIVDTHQSAKLDAWLVEVQNTRERISGLIRDLLSAALPADDLDALERGLVAADGERGDLGTFIGVAEDAVGNALDTLRLGRLVELARGLGALTWRLEEGRQGSGRARVGLVLAPGKATGWAAAFPHNSCSGPVVVDSSGDGVQLAAGLLEGQLRQTAEDLALVNNARLELEHPEDAERLWQEQEARDWRQLNAEERSLCPPLLLVGDSGLLAGRGLAQLVWLLTGELPVKLLLLADLDLGLAALAASDMRLSTLPDATLNLGLLALSQPGSFIAQSALGTPEHYAKSLQRALSYPGPALLHLHAPSPRQHGFASSQTPERTRKAVAARVFPLFQYDPAAEGVFGSRLDLDGNPAPRRVWSTDTIAEAPTPAHWAIGEKRFTGMFEPLDENALGAIPIAEYLTLDREERSRKTPFLERDSENGDSEKLRVDSRLVRVSENCLQTWRRLQELAGLVTPFTARVREEADQAVAAKRKSELESLEAKYAENIRQLQSEMREEMRHETHQRLMRLAGYGQAGAVRKPNLEAETDA